ncbi:Methyltransferase domain protein [uncultured archaeon]|nr:Methyltransferase domain protein [uncultured archaeon]
MRTVRKKPAPRHSFRPKGGKFAEELCFFWHGIFGGKKYPVSFYTRESRGALEQEVEDAMGTYLRSGKAPEADRLERLWELMQTYIVAHNEAVELGRPQPDLPVPARSMGDFLRLLYAGKKPAFFWRAFARRYGLRAEAPEAFWDHFEEFQSRRMRIELWLMEHAKGRSLDLGAGGHSYLMVDVAADVSEKALEKNTLAKKKVVIRPLDAMGSKKWPFPKHAFDTIMLNSVLAYVKDWPRLFKLIRSSLRPGGVLLITNAPVLAHHPASFFMRHEVEARGVARELQKAGFVVRDETEGRLIRLVARLREKAAKKGA